MKVYVAEGHIDYEGFEVLGVFTTRKAAEARCDYVRHATGSYFDDLEISEFELDKAYYFGVQE